MISTIRSRSTLAGSLAVLAIGLAACGTEAEPTAEDVAESTSEMATDMESEMDSEMATDMESEMDSEMDEMESEADEMSSEMDSALTLTPVGEACAQVPADGEGSSEGMADDPVATAASNNPLLGTLVAAVTAAGLGDTLNGLEDATVFAPIDAAFDEIPQEDLDALLADPEGELTTILTLHVVPENLTLADLEETTSVTTVEGSTLDLDFSAGAEEGLPTVSAGSTANVVCGDVQTANATVHLIDAVLLPASS